MEEALHDVPLYREFAKLDGVMARLPDETTIPRRPALLLSRGLHSCQRAASVQRHGEVRRVVDWKRAATGRMGIGHKAALRRQER